MSHLFTADARGLAWFRVGLGALVACDAISRMRDLTAHYTDAGYLPRGEHLARLNHGWVVSLHALSGGAAWQALLFALTISAGIGLALGWRTRVATIACWILVVSAQVRFPVGSNGGDTLLRLLLFWSMFLPLGARMSLDRRRVTGIGESAGAGPPEAASAIDAISPPTRVTSIAVAALFLQVALVYFVSACWKSGPSWRQGLAIQYVLGIEPYATALGDRLREHGLLLRWLTLGVLYLEWTGPLALFSPWRNTLLRTAAVAGFASFQIGLLFTMRLGLFPLVNLVALIPFLPSAFWGESREVAARSLPKFGHGAVIVALAYVFFWNGATLLKIERRLGALAVPAYALQLEQGWSVFAPGLPAELDGWWSAPSDGNVDLYRKCFADEIGPASSAKPPDARGWRLLTNRWAAALMQARLFEEDRPLVAHWLCRCEGAAKSVQLVFYQEEPVLNREPAVERVDLGEFECP